ncbi:LPS assembly protein LptD [Wenzhouxiangella sp. AB-CW3]|uniref:LPS-assembly protein LptD n=1 Tax=Wenzhouxiangella sp. AB-CW3 TaxID=2771012 RepID=UPI00168AE156|nr:LPS assembly protein LptD [Wenzhouxiangella sp. AB-CW3]QOC22927.1 LPS assembly protein LptD [Wenzhouxiangella sp. AB-CW3]
MTRIFAIVVVSGLLWTASLPAVTPVDRPDWCEPPHAVADEGARESVSEAQIRAGAYSAPSDEPVRFSDGVRLKQFDQLLETESLSFDPDSRLVDIPVWLRYTDSLIQIEAARAYYDATDGTGRFDEVIYRLVGHDGSGHADSVAMVEPGQARLERFAFTTCDPDQPDWQLRAARVELALAEGVGTARHARLEFRGVPMMYLPYMSFPLNDERKSGFLYPRIGFSGGDGLDLSVPWYWNIAPNQDATLTPRWIQRRGVMLDSEYRFLTASQRGQADLEILPDDRRAGLTRYFGQFDYRARLAPGWNARADLRRASDDDYFIDLGNDLVESSVQFLRSSVALSGRGSGWRLDLGADDFQLLDDSVAAERAPYRRLPRIQFQAGRPMAHGLEWLVDSELVHFDRDVGVTGTRLDVRPVLRYRWLTPGSFVQPELALRTTHYRLDGDHRRNPDRTLPIASLDAGLFFERPAGSDRIQTLEPRLYYLYVPYRDQADLPDFDTRELTFGFSQLFHHNRFTGADRQGDANQLALALSSRLIEASDGRSLLEGHVGQIVHFSDRRVQLPGREKEQGSRSSTLAETVWRPAEALAVSAGLQWDSLNNETEVARVGLTYRGQDARQAALGYRMRRDQVDQADVRFRYPVNERLKLIGRLLYSFEDNEPLEILGGVEYESCCWALRLTARDYVRDRDGDRRTSVFMELELRGLASLGRAPYELFRDHP